MPGSRRNFLRLSAATALGLSPISGRLAAAGFQSPDEHHHGERKYAFAHYMAGHGTRQRAQSIAEWQSDISDAIAHGIDGWQFNFGRFRNPFAKNIANFVQALERMEAVGGEFKFFPSFDCNHGRTPDVGEIADWFDRYYDHPNHFRLNGRPLLTVWQARHVGDKFFAALKQRFAESDTPIAFVPWLATNGSDLHMDLLFRLWPSIDGFAPWVPGKSVHQANELNEVAARTCRKYGKTLLAGEGFNMLPINKAPRYVNKHAAEAVTQQMMPLIDGSLIDCRMLIVATWNDFGEDHHITPHAPWGPIFGVHPVWCHVGYSVVLKYYLDWWKTGGPPKLEQDVLVIFHLVQMADEGVPPFPYEQYKPDKAQNTVYVTALLTEPGTVTLSSGELEQVQFKAGTGVSHWRANAAPGKQTYGLSRNGSTVLEKVSDKIIESPPTAVWSWSHYSEVTRG